MNISRQIFWDTDYEGIDWEANSRFVIERVLMFGTLDDWKIIKTKFGICRIIEEMKQSRELDPKSMNFLSELYMVPKNEFKCFTQKQFSQRHWSC